MALVTTQMRTDVAGLYAALFGRAPEADGLGYWVDQLANGGRTLAQVAQSMYDTAPARVTYPLYLTNQEIVTKFYQNVLGTTDTDGIAYWTGKLNAGEDKGTLITELMTAVTSYSGTDAAALARTATFNNKVAVGLDYAVTLNGNDVGVASTLLTNVDATAASVTAAEALAANGVGKSFTLTAGIDAGAAFTGGSANDTYTANASTLSALDSLDGGAGTDTLTIYGVTAAGAAADVDLTLPTSIKNIENLSVVATSSKFVGNAADVSHFTGLKSVNFAINDGAAQQTVTATATLTDLTVADSGTGGVKVVGGGGVLNISSKGAVNVGTTNVVNGFTTATIAAAGAVTIKDIADTSGNAGTTLTTVSLDGTSTTGAVTDAVTGDGVTTLNLSNFTAGANNEFTVNNSKAHTLNVNLSKVSANTLADAKATTVNVVRAGSSASSTWLTMSSASAVNISGDAALTIRGLTQKATAVDTITGAGNVTISNLTLPATIDASAATGKVTINTSLSTSTTFTGGSGNDTITVGATTKAIAMGAGNDKVTIAGSALGTGGTVAGGAGTDTLAFDTFAHAVTASASTTLSTKVSGFEVLSLGAAAATGSINLANLNGTSANAINTVQLTADVTQAATYTGLTSGGTIEFDHAQTAATTVGITNAAVSTTDVLNLTIKAAAGADVNTVNAASVETVNFTTTDTNATAANIQHTATLVDTTASAITVSGSAGLALTFAGTGLTSFDASGVTNGSVSYTTAALTKAATLLVHGHGGSTIDATAATKAVTITDSATAGAADTLTGGAGNDTITVGANGATVTGGIGSDTINLSASSAKVDTVNFADGDSVDASYDVVNGFNAAATNADILHFSTNVKAIAADVAVATTIPGGGGINSAGVNFTEASGIVTFGGNGLSAKGLVDLIACARAIVDSQGVDSIAAFEYQGNTFVVAAGHAAANVANDSVVELVGVTGLTAIGAAAAHTLVIS